MKNKYTLEELVHFMKWNTNAPVSAIRKAGKAGILKWIDKNDAWEVLENQIDNIREELSLEKEIKNVYKGLF